MKSKSSPGKPISSYFSTNKDISLLVTEPKKRKQFEEHFKFIPLPEDQKAFLEKFSKLEGLAGEWKFLSEKFKNESLKKVAEKRLEQEKAKNSNGILVTEEIQSVVAKPKDGLWKVIGRFFFGFLIKKSST